MAALIASPARQPFGALDGSRLRQLTNIKNRQNALPVTLSSPVKRRREVEDTAELDTENIDPLWLSSKKSKFGERPNKGLKDNTFVLKTVNAPVRPMATPVRHVAPSNAKTTGFTAPATVGRSPKSKRAVALSRRRVSASPFTRIDPPSRGTPSAGLPFSIDEALADTLSSYKAKSTTKLAGDLSDRAVPKGWMFEIHEDTPDELAGNLIEFSTQTLDISDDEAKAKAKAELGKENIPPADASAALAAVSAPSRRDAMTDEARTPLGDLHARDYYAQGCDATSHVIVPGDADELPESLGQDATQGAPDLKPALSSGKAVPGDKEGRDLPSTQAEASADIETPSDAETIAATVDIWESESAKDDATDTEAEPVTVTKTLEESLAAANQISA